MEGRGRMPPAVMESVLGVKRILRGPLSYSLSSALRLVLPGKNGDRGAHKWREGERDTIVDAMPGQCQGERNVDAERPTLPEQRRLRLAKPRRPTAACCVRCDAGLGGVGPSLRESE